ncbi:MAG: tRNA-dihydrouridine synthase family protein [Planctomycetes bacterium]|nr:tRNA-dihydrouridine synthase family protein [Planctomycetota bacterium]
MTTPLSTPRRAFAPPLAGFDAPFFLAGLAGYSDAAMRLTARRLGAPFCVTEAMLDTLLLSGGKSLRKADPERLKNAVLGARAEADESQSCGEGAGLEGNLAAGLEDHPLAGQIIGSTTDGIAEAARLVVELGFDVVDLNLACPSKKSKRKVLRGGNLLAEPELAIELLRAVRDAVPPHVPRSVKLRRGFDEGLEWERAFHRIFEAAIELGYAWATVHARTVEQRYVGRSHWPFLTDLVARYPQMRIFGSGDVFEVRDIFRMLDETGVQAVSVARGAIANPFLFREARAVLRGEELVPASLAEQRELLLAHASLAWRLHGEEQGTRLMRKFALRMAERHPDPLRARSTLVAVRRREDLAAALDALYAVSIDR